MEYSHIFLPLPLQFPNISMLLLLNLADQYHYAIIKQMRLESGFTVCAVQIYDGMCLQYHTEVKLLVLNTPSSPTLPSLHHPKHVAAPTFPLSLCPLSSPGVKQVKLYRIQSSQIGFLVILRSLHTIFVVW